MEMRQLDRLVVAVNLADRTSILSADGCSQRALELKDQFLIFCRFHGENIYIGQVE